MKPAVSPRSLLVNVAPALAVAITPTPCSSTEDGGDWSCRPKPCSLIVSSGVPPPSGAPVSTPACPGARRMATAETEVWEEDVADPDGPWAGRFGAGWLRAGWLRTGWLSAGWSMVQTRLVRPTSGGAAATWVAVSTGTWVP